MSSPPDKYSLRVPFQVQPGYTFGSTGSPSRTTFDNLSVSLDQAQDGYALRLDGFSSTESALRFTPRIWTGLTTLMMERGSAFSGSMSPRPVAYTEHMGKPSAGSLAKAFEASSGKPLEGVADGDAPSIYETDKNVAFLQMGTPTVTVSVPADQALASLIKGFRTESAQRLFDDERLHTAVDLYAAALFEQSPAARLLTLSMAFEVLAPVTYKHEVIRKLAEQWRNDVAKARLVHAKDELAIASLDSFERELLFKQETSISGRIRECVLEELGSDAHAKAQAKRALSAYDARSKLLHDGRLDPTVRGKAIEDFTDVLKQIVLRRIRMTAA
jgi:hypothetical protein